MSVAAIALPRPRRAPDRMWSCWLAACVALNFSFGEGLYGSQFLLAALCWIWLLMRLAQGDPKALWVAAAVAAFACWAWLVGGENERFWPEMSKFLLLVLGTAVLLDLDAGGHWRTITLALPLVIAALAAHAWLTGSWDYYDPWLGRYGIPSLGSPNTTAYVLALTLLLLHYRLKTSGRRMRWVGAAAYLFLLLSLAATQSRGGLLIYLIGLFVITDSSGRKLLFVAAIAFGLIFAYSEWALDFGRFNLLLDIRETGGSGRLEIWGILLDDLWANPLSLLVGAGPGGVDFYLAEVYSVRSTHSMVVEVLYSYGLIGLLGTMTALVWAARRAHHERDFQVRRMRLALLAALFGGWLFDSYPMTAQIVWFTPVMLALAVRSGSPRRTPAAEAV